MGLPGASTWERGDPVKTLCTTCGTIHDEVVGCPMEVVTCSFCRGTGLVLDEGHTYEMAPGGKVRCSGCAGTGKVKRPKRSGSA